MAFGYLLSSTLVLLITILSVNTSLAHEVVPAIADMRQDGRVLKFDIRLNLEAVLAGIDLTEFSDTNDADGGDRYDTLRALAPDDFEMHAWTYWPIMAKDILILAAHQKLEIDLSEIEVITENDPELSRDSVLHFTVALPKEAQNITFAWAPKFGSIVLRQQGVDDPYTGFLEAGAISEPIALIGGGAQSGWEAFASYIPVGFRHILPKGLDHILFILGLFFLSTKMRPLLTQVTTFTIAHTITLALAALGWVSVPGTIVEPLIAASIVFVAVENIFTSGLSRWRPFVVFGFGLLHGLGFASVLGQFGLPENAFIPALIGFNVGVELGQLTIIAMAFALIGYWFRAKAWYHRMIKIPASIAIALMGAWWVIERTLL